VSISINSNSAAILLVIVSHEGRSCNAEAQSAFRVYARNYKFWKSQTTETRRSIWKTFTIYRDASLFDTGSISSTLHCITLHYSNPTQLQHTAIMPRSCIICSAVASQEIMIQYCGACKSALYCSRACQKKDWKKQHKEVCKLLNVGHGDMQVRTDVHTSRSVARKEAFEIQESNLTEDMKRFLKLFEESTFEGSRAAAQKMKKIAKRQVEQNQKFLLIHSLYLLVLSNLEMLSWPNSPLLVMLHFVSPHVMSGDEETRFTPLHYLAAMADPCDYSSHEKQVILAKQLIEHGANVNAVSIPGGETPLHRACYSGNVTNLDFVELLLEEGANPNAQDHLGMTPLHWSAPGAAKFLLNWPTTDANITTRSGVSFLAKVRETVEKLSDRAARPDNPGRVQVQFLFQQWRKIEEMLVERGAANTGITNFE
jgi:hypothetical protein